MKISRLLYLISSFCMLFIISACLVAASPPQQESNMSEAKSNADVSEAKSRPDKDDNIIILETDPVLDDDGYVTVSMEAAEDVILPVKITMKGSNKKKISFTISRNGQALKLKPDTYKIIRVIDGAEKKLASGARLTISDEGGVIYFDFNKPESDLGFDFYDIVKTNAAFLFIAVLCYFVYQRYLKANHMK